MTKRGRGQRRSRRLKNRDLDEAQRRAAQHIRYNYRNKASRQVWDTLVHYFRELAGLTKRGDPSSWRLIVPRPTPLHVDCDCMSCRPG